MDVVFELLCLVIFFRAKCTPLILGKTVLSRDVLSQPPTGNNSPESFEVCRFSQLVPSTNYAQKQYFSVTLRTAGHLVF